jgi:hypothetical protein
MIHKSPLAKLAPAGAASAQRDRRVDWKQVGFGPLALLLVLPLMGFGYQSISTALDARAYPPPGRA